MKNYCTELEHFLREKNMNKFMILEFVKMILEFAKMILEFVKMILEFAKMILEFVKMILEFGKMILEFFVFMQLSEKAELLFIFAENF